jgi:ribosomal protein S18 acetylase RimI-like enzyme
MELGLSQESRAKRMTTPTPIPLTPVLTAPNENDYQAILTWPFAPQPFYEGQVIRLLQHDIPLRVLHSMCLVWVYRDPDGNAVGFGTLDFCKDYEQFTGGKVHAYIPLLAVNPGFQKRGHGRSIVEHLIAEAEAWVHGLTELSDLLFLDVYVANHPAIKLYEKYGFVTLNPDTPEPDPGENNEGFFVMARKVGVAGEPSPSGSP